MKDRLDEIDLNILRMLQADGRMSNAEVARRVGLSPPSVLQRIRKLETEGYINRYAAMLDRQSMGFSLIVMAMISLSLHQEQPIERFRKAISDVPEVLECLNTSGDFDFLLKIVVKDMRHYEQFVRETLSRIEGVGRIQSCFVLSVCKESTDLPI